jgi:hypothetical protein
LVLTVDLRQDPHLPAKYLKISDLARQPEKVGQIRVSHVRKSNDEIRGLNDTHPPGGARRVEEFPVSNWIGAR